MIGPVCCWKCGLCGRDVPNYRRRCTCQSNPRALAPTGRTNL